MGPVERNKRYQKKRGDNWIRATWNRQEEMGLKTEANKNNTTFPLKRDNLFPFSFGLLDWELRGLTQSTWVSPELHPWHLSPLKLYTHPRLHLPSLHERLPNLYYTAQTLS